MAMNVIDIIIKLCKLMGYSHHLISTQTRMTINDESFCYTNYLDGNAQFFIETLVTVTSRTECRCQLFISASIT